VRLAEFVVGLGRAGKQVILETHSEHIVNAIRVLAAESSDPVECGVFFIDTSDGVPRIVSLTVAEDGTVSGWPRGFFGEAALLRGRLLRAQQRFLSPPE
jgi:predicted ATPase